eukprot:2782384-Amphidinium_carterae.1
MLAYKSTSQGSSCREHSTKEAKFPKSQEANPKKTFFSAHNGRVDHSLGGSMQQRGVAPPRVRVCETRVWGYLQT